MKTEFTLLTLSDNFPDEESCIRYFEKMRWGDKVVSPYDATSKVYKCSNGRYKCKNTGCYFDVKTGTAFANTKLPLRAWFYAMMLFLSYKRGISSCQLARDLGITQKTAWNMLHKIRQYMTKENNHVLSGEVEIDETFVGGKNKNRHKDKKVEKCQGRSFKDKVPVFGILERNGKVIAKVVSNTQAKTLVPIVRKNVEAWSVVYTDGWEYTGLIGSYKQMSVDHEKHFYGTTYATEYGEIITISTNGIENVWSHFKRMIIGIYYHVSKEYMQRYVDEYIFRFNTRNYSDSQRFNLLLRNIA
ncbi:IS1595 family transposase [Bacteroides fragilis]|uniref:IS1595 family transposase n=1 Tax=Bacteroides fragilis TaxID=817 RepID=UPI001459F01D|nr:IS1595 family transposase [Bacteroides fragilis]NME76420.1 IS1595 family transposase [Bacteroides fragilis]